MRIGLASGLQHETPEQWAQQLAGLGCKAAVFPVDYTQPDHVIADYVSAAEKYDLVIAEVGIWNNVLAADPAERSAARERAEGQLRMADEIGAGCCVNITGTYGGPVWDGGYPENLTKQCWEEIVKYTRDLLDTVKPVRTEYSVEPMPWMYPTGPDEYLQLLNDVDRPGFAIHLDLINMINCPQRYFFMDDFMQECFDKMGTKIRSCHLKDIILKRKLTFQLEETALGSGILNVEKLVTLINQYNPDMPLIIEHLTTDEEYLSSLNYIKKRLDLHIPGQSAQPASHC